MQPRLVLFMFALFLVAYFGWIIYAAKAQAVEIEMRTATVHDLFVCAAFSGLAHDNLSRDERVREAYRLADEMMKRRSKEK